MIFTAAHPNPAAAPPPADAAPPFPDGLTGSRAHGLTGSFPLTPSPLHPITPSSLPSLSKPDSDLLDAWYDHGPDARDIARALSNAGGDTTAGGVLRRLSAEPLRDYIAAARDARDDANRQRSIATFNETIRTSDDAVEKRRAANGIIRALSARRLPSLGAARPSLGVAVATSPILPRLGGGDRPERGSAAGERPRSPCHLVPLSPCHAPPPSPPHLPTSSPPHSSPSSPPHSSPPLEPVVTAFLAAARDPAGPDAALRYCAHHWVRHMLGRESLARFIASHPALVGHAAAQPGAPEYDDELDAATIPVSLTAPGGADETVVLHAALERSPPDGIPARWTIHGVHFPDTS